MLADTDHMYAGRINHTSSIEGQPQDPAHGFFEQHLVGPNITIARVTATVSGGGAAKDAARVPQHQTLTPWPRTLGTRPVKALLSPV